MPNRKYTVASSYRYGFNGKENDKDVSEGSLDFGERVLDVRLGRFLSVDPLTKDYPQQTPYAYALNCPIRIIDVLGLSGGDPFITYKMTVTNSIDMIRFSYKNIDQTVSSKVTAAHGSYLSEMGRVYGSYGGTMQQMTGVGAIDNILKAGGDYVYENIKITTTVTTIYSGLTSIKYDDRSTKVVSIHTNLESTTIVEKKLEFDVVTYDKFGKLIHRKHHVGGGFDNGTSASAPTQTSVQGMKGIVSETKPMISAMLGSRLGPDGVSLCKISGYENELSFYQQIGSACNWVGLASAMGSKTGVPWITLTAETMGIASDIIGSAAEQLSEPVQKLHDKWSTHLTVGKGRTGDREFKQDRSNGKITATKMD